MLFVPPILYPTLIEEIAEASLSEMKADFYASAGTSDENLNFFSFYQEDPSDFWHFLDEFLCGEMDKVLSKYKMYGAHAHRHSNALSHEYAMWVIRSSENIHKAIDGAYRKHNYQNMAESAIRGDVMMYVSKTYSIKMTFDPYNHVA